MGTNMRESLIGGLLAFTAVVTILLVAGAELAAAEWISIGPEGGAVTALVLNPQNPTTLYAGMYSMTGAAGVFKSLDCGYRPS